MTLFIEIATVSIVLKVTSASREFIFTPRAVVNFSANFKTKGEVNARQNGEKEIKIVNPIRIAESSPFCKYCQPLRINAVINSKIKYIFIFGIKIYTSSFIVSLYYAAIKRKGQIIFEFLLQKVYTPFILQVKTISDKIN